MPGSTGVHHHPVAGTPPADGGVPQCIDVHGVDGVLERDRDVGLCAQVVDLIGLDVLQQVGQRVSVGQVAVVQEHPGLVQMRVQVQVVDALRTEGAGATDQPVDLIALVQQQLGQVGTVLAGDPREEGLLRSAHVNHPKRRCRMPVADGIASGTMRVDANPGTQWCGGGWGAGGPGDRSSACPVPSGPARHRPREGVDAGRTSVGEQLRRGALGRLLHTRIGQGGDLSTGTPVAPRPRGAARHRHRHLRQGDRRNRRFPAHGTG